jgi:hypothetical protein
MSKWTELTRGQWSRIICGLECRVEPWSTSAYRATIKIGPTRESHHVTYSVKAAKQWCRRTLKRELEEALRILR